MISFVLVSCQKDSLNRSSYFISPYGNLSALHFYSLNTGNYVIFKFWDGNSTASYVDVKINITKTGSRQVLQVTFVECIAHVSSPQFKHLEGDLTATVIPVKGFEPQKWDVVYKDESGLHSVEYGGILQEPLKPYISGRGEGPLSTNF